jgi:hypothetical protein
MYVGHFAAGLAIKASEPRAPTWALLVGVGLLDILFGPFVLVGIERATVTPSVSPGFSLGSPEFFGQDADADGFHGSSAWMTEYARYHQV